LVPIGTNWYKLVQIGTNWYQRLVPIGTKVDKKIDKKAKSHCVISVVTENLMIEFTNNLQCQPYIPKVLESNIYYSFDIYRLVINFNQKYILHHLIFKKVPCAAAGSLPFLPDETIAVLRNIKSNYPNAWQRYGFVDAFNPTNNW